MSAISRLNGYVEKPLRGVAYCPKCKAVGTIVEMGRCCSIAKLVSKGSLWDVPAKLLRTGRHHGPRKFHG